MLNKPSPRLQILREQLAREKFAQQNARELYAHSAANPRTTHHYPPDYNADLADMWPAKPASKTPQPAAPAALVHLVCVKHHVCALGGEVCDVGMVVSMPRADIYEEMQHPECWLLCDPDGFIPHTPTAYSTCPVPDGMRFEAEWADGEISNGNNGSHRMNGFWRKEDNNDIDHFVKWRPVAGGSAT